MQAPHYLSDVESSLPPDVTIGAYRRSRARKRRVAFVLAAVVAVLPFAGCSHAAQPTAHCTEDAICWSSLIDGNHLGRDRVFFDAR